MREKIILATRQSPLALKQTDLAIDYLREKLPQCVFEILPMMTTGDRQASWSLECEGGKGLFTKELESALLNRSAQLAVHSTKDLPTTLPEGLCLIGFLPREDPRDVLIYRKGLVPEEIKTLATGSPRRRAQAVRLLSSIEEVIEIRGRVSTRLEKIASGYADATILAAAGLKRLGIESHEKLDFRYLEPHEMVPAVGQGAIGFEAAAGLTEEFQGIFDQSTEYAIQVERAFLKALGGGCHAAFAGHYADGFLSIFHEKSGYQKFKFSAKGEEAINLEISKIIEKI